MATIKLSNNVLISKDSIEKNVPTLDMTRVLASFNTSGSSTYTATEDCFVIGKAYSPKIDNVFVSSDTSGSADIRVCMFLKKGQIFYNGGYATWGSNYKVFGLK